MSGRFRERIRQIGIFDTLQGLAVCVLFEMFALAHASMSQGPRVDGTPTTSRASSGKYMTALPKRYRHLHFTPAPANTRILPLTKLSVSASASMRSAVP
jgi:hypothetical protein